MGFDGPNLRDKIRALPDDDPGDPGGLAGPLDESGDLPVEQVPPSVATEAEVSFPFDWRQTAVYPANVAAEEWLDCTAAMAGNEVRLPVFATVGARQACAVRTITAVVGGSLLVTTTDGTLINGQPSFPLSQAYEHYEFFKAGTQWGVRG